MTLTCKHVPANAQQIPNLKLLVALAKQMGANQSQMAGAMATMIQESNAVNLSGGDRDSAGLFQQRPSMGWGSYAQVTNPTYAINKFLSKYMPLVKRGVAIFAASDQVQGSAFPQAPAQWYDESWANVTQLTSGKDFIDATSLGGSTSSTTTRVQPYEFSRGNAGQRETSWDCIGRLADEVSWDRFMRGGALWFVSENYLKSQPPRFTFSVGARGVTAINFDSDSRRNAAEATVTALAKRWSVLPGDVVTVSGEGPGDGLWLVSDARRTLWDDTTEITLKRPVAPKLEPANTTTTVTVGGLPSLGGSSASGAPKLAQDFYAACKAISDRGLPYVYGGGHGAVGVASGGGFDCSGSVCAALGAVKLGYQLGGPCAVSGTMATSWGVAGPGKYFTVWANPEHVWVQFHGFPNWRFDTSPHGDGPPGPRLRKSARSTAGFTPKHWPGL
jgi:hypothetical protein